MKEEERKVVKKWSEMSDDEQKSVILTGIHQIEKTMGIKNSTGETTDRISREAGRRRACCGLYSSYFADLLSHLGIEVRISSAEKINAQRGILSSQTFDHKFAVIGDPSHDDPTLFTPTHIIDMTLCQFITSDGHISQEGIGESALTVSTPIAQEVLTTGFFPYSQSKLSEYMDLLTVGRPTRRTIQPELVYFHHP